MLWMIPANKTKKQTISVMEITLFEEHHLKMMKQQCNRKGQTERTKVFILNLVSLQAIAIPARSYIKIATRKITGFQSRTNRGKMTFVKQRYQLYSIQALISLNRLLFLVFILSVNLNLDYFTHSNLQVCVLFAFNIGCTSPLLDYQMRTRKQQKGKSVKSRKKRRQIAVCILVCRLQSPNDKTKDQGSIKDCMRPIICPQIIFYFSSTSHYLIMLPLLINFLAIKQSTQVKNTLNTEMTKLEKFPTIISEVSPNYKALGLVIFQSVNCGKVQFIPNMLRILTLMS